MLYVKKMFCASSIGIVGGNDRYDVYNVEVVTVVVGVK